MRCPNCNSEFKQGQNECEYCGTIIKSAKIENTAKRHIISIIVYYAIIYFLVAFIQIGIMDVYQTLSGNPVYDSNNELLPQAENFIMIWNQIIVYFILFISISLILLKDIINDFGKIKNNFKGVLKHAGIGIVLMYMINILLTTVSGKIQIVGSSVNQSTIEDMIYRSGSLELFLYAIVLIICAPVVEELIFRKGIFQILKKFNLPTNKKILISGLLFGLLHVLSTILNYIATGSSAMTILIELVYSLPYIGTGFVLSYIYAETEENVITPMIAHMFNNAMSCLAMFLLYTKCI